MKKKITFVDFWSGFEPQKSIFYKTLSMYYELELVELTEAEYVFYSVFGDGHLYAPTKAVTIFFTGENRTPNFNECDYGIGFERISFRDRYIRFPLYYLYPEFEYMERKHEINRETIKQQKDKFCSFTVSNGNCPPRIQMFEELSKYKRVDSGGRFMNNIGGGD